MIASETAALAIGIARGLIKCGGRLDQLRAEKTAVTEALALTLPQVRGGPSTLRKVAELREWLAPPNQPSPPSLAPHRLPLERLLAEPEPDARAIQRFYELIYPGRALSPVIDPNTEFIRSLAAAFPSVRFDDPATRCAAFYVAAGVDDRQVGYPLRLGLLLVDVLAEFGSQHAGLFVREPQTQALVQAILERFAAPDLEQYTDWSPLLRQVLSATLNGAIDARAAWAGDGRWLNALLRALADARDAAGTGGDDYLAGLLQGKGYRQLIGPGLARAAEQLEAQHADAFGGIAADLLKAAVPWVTADPGGFGHFFTRRWADLLRAGLESVAQHGPVLLEGTHPLLRDVSLALVGRLARTPEAALLSGASLQALAQTAISVAATHPKLLQDGAEAPWLQALIESALGTLRAVGPERGFSRAGVETMLVSALGRLGERPELWDADYAGLVAGLVGGLTEVCRPGRLPERQVAGLLAAVLDAIEGNPRLFAKLGGAWVAEVNRVVLTVNAAEAVWFGATRRVTLAARVCRRLAQSGQARLDALGPDVFLQDLSRMLSGGLAAVGGQLGCTVDLASATDVLEALVRAWLRGDLAVADPQEPQFLTWLEQAIEELAPRTRLVPKETP